MGESQREWGERVDEIESGTRERKRVEREGECKRECGDWVRVGQSGATERDRDREGEAMGFAKQL